MSPALYLPTTFPKPLPPPNIPLRIPPLVREAKPIPYPKNDNDDNDKSDKALAKHLKSRTPLAINTSQRLHAVLGIRNELPFELPAMPTSPRCLGAGLGLGLGLGITGAAGLGFGGVGIGIEGIASVDAKSGRGLREFLLQKGKERGVRKVKGRSLAFYGAGGRDMRGDGMELEFLGGYAAERGCRVDYYEVELPMMKKDGEVENATQKGIKNEMETETWIWFLISRPLLSTPLTPSISQDRSKSKSVFHGTSSDTQLPLVISTTTSWLVFALPKKNCTFYPISTNASPPADTPDTNNDLSEKPLSASDPSTSSQTNNPHNLNITTKRLDIELSFSGLPLFEFSAKPPSVPSTADLRLYVESLIPVAPYENKNNENEPGFSSREQGKVDDEIDRLKMVYDDAMDGKWLCLDGDDGDEVGEGDAGLGLEERVVMDVERWHGIRDAMARGRCRIVFMWDEAEMETETQDVVMGELKMERKEGEQKGEREKERERGASKKRLHRSVSSNVLIGGIPSRPRTRAAARARVVVEEEEGVGDREKKAGRGRKK